jgi:hypothetical protein
MISNEKNLSRKFYISTKATFSYKIYLHLSLLKSYVFYKQSDPTADR